VEKQDQKIPTPLPQNCQKKLNTEKRKEDRAMKQAHYILETYQSLIGKQVEGFRDYFWVISYDYESIELLVEQAIQSDFSEVDIYRMLDSKTVDLLDDTFDCLGLELINNEIKKRA